MKLRTFAIAINIIIGLFNIAGGLIALGMGNTNSLILSMGCAICCFLVANVLAILSLNKNN